MAVFQRHSRMLQLTNDVQQYEWLTPPNAVWFYVISKSHCLRVLVALNSNLWTQLPFPQQDSGKQQAIEELQAIAIANSDSCAPGVLPAIVFGDRALFPLRLDLLEQMQAAIADANSLSASSRLPLFRAWSMDEQWVATDSIVRDGRYEENRAAPTLAVEAGTYIMSLICKHLTANEWHGRSIPYCHFD